MTQQQARRLTRSHAVQQVTAAAVLHIVHHRAVNDISIMLRYDMRIRCMHKTCGGSALFAHQGSDMTIA